MTVTVTRLENKESSVWAIATSDPIQTDSELKELLDVRLAIATGIKGTPYFERKTPTYWFLIDKPITEEESELDYIKDCVASYLLLPKVTREVVDPLQRNGFIDLTTHHNSADRVLLEKHFEKFVTFNLSYNGSYIPVRITHMEYDKKINDLHKLNYTLALVR